MTRISARLLHRAGILLALAGLAVSTHAQITETTIRFDRLGVEDGLPDWDVNALLQDDRGFVWVGTDDGLARFDGYSFTVFRYDPDDPNSLHDTTIRELHIDADGNLWIATFSGIERYDPRTGRFTAFAGASGLPDRLPTDEYNEVHVDRNGFVWAGSDRNGVFRMDPATGNITHFGASGDDPLGGNSGLTHPRIVEIFEARDGTIWVATGQYGLHRYDPQAQQFVKVEFPSSVTKGIHPGDGFTHITEDESGVLWLGGWGVIRYDPVTETPTTYLPEPDVPAPAPPRYDNYVSSLQFAAGGQLWVGTYDRGLFRLDPTTGVFTDFVSDATETTPGSGDTVNELLLDRSGVLWVGRVDEGISRLDPRREFVQRLDGSPQTALSQIAEDAQQNLWFGFRDVLVRWNPESRSGRTFRHGAASGGLLNSYLSYLARLDRDPDALWVGTSDGALNRLDIRGSITERYPLKANPDFESHPFFSIIEIPNQPGIVLAAVWDAGLCRIDTETAEISCIARGTGDLAHDPRHLTADVQYPGIVWVPTDEGLQRLDSESMTFTDHYRHIPGDTTSLSINLVDNVVISQNEPAILWIGTWSGGLNRFDSNTGKVTHRYSTRNSRLPHDTINDIIEDRDGILWISTPMGVVRFDPVSGAMLDVTDALGMPLAASRGFLALNGDIVLGVNNEAAYRFDPRAFRPNERPPDVVLTDLYLRDERVRPGADSFLERPLSFTDEVELPFKRRDVAFEYVALDYLQPEGVRYAYRLNGYDDRWRDAGSQRRASYTNLAPGRYRFQVRAANAEGVWNEEGVSVDLNILPPWWRTVWAYTIYGLLAVGTVFGVDRVQRRRVAAKERERTREKELAQAREIERAYAELRVAKDRLVHQEKLASLGQLTAGIGHEIKNPLNFVNNFAEVSAELSAEIREAYNQNSETKLSDVIDVVGDLEQNSLLIKEHGLRADRIVRSMMDHAANNAGERQSTDLNQLVSEHVDLAYHGRRTQSDVASVEIVRDFGSDVGLIDIVPQEIGRVVVNLVGNAIDAVAEANVPDGGNGLDGADRADGPDRTPAISVITRRTGEMVTITVADNGSGIPPDLIDKIFEPFFTTKPAGSGTGLGLSLSHDIVVQGHGGTLRVDRSDETGTVFTVSLPA